MDDQHENLTDEGADASARREFLKRCGKYAVVVPPAMALLLTRDANAGDVLIGSPGGMTQTDSPICLLEGTRVLGASGSARHIECLEIGDIVRCFDVKAGRIDVTTVTDVVRRHLRAHYYVVNSDLRITNDHPVLRVGPLGAEWVRVEQLCVGDTLCLPDGSIPVRTLRRVDRPAMTVYLETEAENFLALGHDAAYVVHGHYRDSLAIAA